MRSAACAAAIACCPVTLAEHAAGTFGASQVNSLEMPTADDSTTLENHRSLDVHRLPNDNGTEGLPSFAVSSKREGPSQRGLNTSLVVDDAPALRSSNITRASTQSVVNPGQQVEAKVSSPSILDVATWLAAALGGIIILACSVLLARRYRSLTWRVCPQRVKAWCLALRPAARDKGLPNNSDNLIVMGLEQDDGTLGGPLSGCPVGMSINNEIPAPETLDSFYYDFSAPR